jgi:hypothetical protein
VGRKETPEDAPDRPQSYPWWARFGTAVGVAMESAGHAVEWRGGDAYHLPTSCPLCVARKLAGNPERKPGPAAEILPSTVEAE